MTRRTAIRSLALRMGMFSKGIATTAQEVAPSRLTVEVEDEFGPLKAAIVHDACNAIDIDNDLLQEWEALGVLESHPETALNSSGQVAKEVSALRKLLRSFGVEIFAPDTVEGAYCQVFTRDPCFAIGKTLYLGVLADEHREGEVKGLAKLHARCDSWWIWTRGT